MKGIIGNSKRLYSKISIDGRNNLCGKVSKPSRSATDGLYIKTKWSVPLTRELEINKYAKRIKSKTYILTDEQKNLSNWSKNMDFPIFENTYTEDGHINELKYQGGNGYERMYLSVDTEIGKEYILEFDFTSKSGFSCSYGDSVDYAFVSSESSAVSNSAFSTSSAIGYVVLDNTASDTTKHYTINFIATSKTTYIGVDMGYMIDGVLTDLCFKDFTLYTVDYDYIK